MSRTVSKSRALGCALAAVVALGAPGMALGGDGHGHPCSGRSGPCAADVRALCPDASSRDDARRCLHEHADKLSPACAEKVEARRQRHLAVQTACEPDLAALCSDVQGHDARQCLHEHRGELSDTCSQALDSLHRPCGEQTPG